MAVPSVASSVVPLVASLAVPSAASLAVPLAASLANPSATSLAGASSSAAATSDIEAAAFDTEAAAVVWVCWKEEDVTRLILCSPLLRPCPYFNCLISLKISCMKPSFLPYIDGKNNFPEA